jgi:hypothetical protein
MNETVRIEGFQRDVERLATSVGRKVGTAAHEQARRYLVERMAEEGLEAYDESGYERPYRFDGYELCNLIGVVPGQDRSAAPVLIAAHYDTCGPYPGADDNAAAVTLALSCVEFFKDNPLERDLIIALFDGEEPPLFHEKGMGSTWFYENQRRTEIHAALVLDLVGHAVGLPGFEDLIFVTGAESDPCLPELLRQLPEIEGVRALAALNRYVGDMSDHHIFRLNKRPYLFLSCGRWEHYHQPTDTPDRLDYKKMVAIRQLLIALLSGLSASSLSGPFDGNDTTPLECDLMNEHLGPLLAQFGMKVETRADIDKLVHMLKSRLGL